jgi:uncharacterized protein (TIGR03437 family)
MYRLSAMLLLAGAAAWGDTPGTNTVASTVAGSLSYTGVFSQDTDQAEVFFNLQTAGNVVLRTFSYAGGVNGAGTTIPRGGFDPTLSLFDSTGQLVAANQDGGCGLVAADAVTGMCWDSYMALSLPAGNYRLVVTQSANTANGPTLADGFHSFCSAADQNAANCTQNFTPDPSPGILPAGFWDESRNQRVGSYAVDVTGATTATGPSITSSPALPGGTVGQFYQFTFAAQPTGTYTWSIVGGALPLGLTLNSGTGILSGVISAAGTFSFTVQATDGVETLQQTFTLIATSVTVPSPVFISTPALPSGTVGQAYGPFQVSAGGGSGFYSWTATGLPAGLTISASGGQISGVPATAGASTSIIITVQDQQTGSSASTAPLSMTINNPVLSVSGTGTSGEIVLGSAVSTVFSATGGTAPYTWSSANLPPGLTLNAATGALTGIPQQPGSYAFTIVATDSQTPHNTLNFPFSLQVFGLVTSPTLPNGSTGSLYSQTLSAAGGKTPYVFSSPNLPSWLNLTGAVLSGTPSLAGTYVFSVQITDANGFIATSLETLVVTAPGALSVSGGPLPGGTVSFTYSQTLSSTGGTPPVTWAVITGALPNGLSLSSGGAIAGTPYKTGTFTFTAQVTDNAGISAAGIFMIVVAPQPLLIFGLPVPSGILGSDYPPQILTGTGGATPYTFTVTGTLPPGLTFANGQLSGIPTASGTFSLQLTMTDSGTPALTVTSPLEIVVNPPGTNLILSAASISFTLTAAASGLPAPQSVTVESSDVQQLLNYSVAATPAATWLDVSQGGTTTPGSITMALDPSAVTLPPSTTALTTSVLVTCFAPSSCAGKTSTISVTLNVTAPSPQLVFSSSLIQFNATASNSAALSQSVALQNIGAGSSAITSVTAADSWLTVSGVPAAVAGGPAVSLIFTASPAGMGTGFFRTVVTVNSPGGSVSIPVTFSITQAPTVLLSTKGAQFQTILGSSPGNIQGSFEISTAGGAGVSWTAAVQSGGSWLALNTASGSVSPSSPQTISYTLNRAGAAALSPAGTFYGVIQVVAAGAANSPQTFQVILNVAPAASLAIPDPEPGGLIFTSIAGAAAPASQNVTIYAGSTAATPYSASAATLSGGTWLTLASAIGASSISNPGVSVVSVNPGTLAPGVYRGNVSYQFSAAAVRTVNVTMIVEASGAGCTPHQLVPTLTGLVTNFSIAMSLPTPLSLRVLQDCGAAVGNAQVTATFSNGDPPLALNLVDPSSGLYAGTWTPQSASPQVTVTATAAAPGFSTSTAQATGQIAWNAAPFLTPGGAVHIYDPLIGGALAPGTILSIYGSNLAPAAVPNTAPSLGMTLGGTSVAIGGVLAPLYYVSPTQIDAELPVELVPGGQYEVIVNSAGALSTAGSIQVIAAAPGIAAFPNGQIIAQHLDYSLVSSASPAKPGEYIVFYLAGLGLTDTSVADGAASPLNPLAHPLIAPVLTLNGSNTPIAFAGLTPNFVGLYQINFQVPLNTPNGNIILAVSQSGAASNSTVLPVHN